MYLGLDFLIEPSASGGPPKPWLIEVNVGLPGGAQEYDLTHQVYRGRESGIFDLVESISRGAYGRSFKDYLSSLPFLEPLKALKLWMDGCGPFPEVLHPTLRLEDKWVQYQILGSRFPMPRTALYDPSRPDLSAAFHQKCGRAVLKRRTGRGGRGLVLIDGPDDLASAPRGPHPRMLQERVESRLEGFSVSIRAVAFAGRFIAAYANLARRPASNHGYLAFVAAGDIFRLENPDFEVRPFDRRSWEAALWFGPDASEDPPHLRHNLNEDEVAATALILPHVVLEEIREISVRVERLYENLDYDALPPAWFESPPPLPA